MAKGGGGGVDERAGGWGVRNSRYSSSHVTDEVSATGSGWTADAGVFKSAVAIQLASSARYLYCKISTINWFLYALLT